MTANATKTTATLTKARMVEILDHVLRYAYRGTPDGDPALIAEASTALIA